MSSKPKTVRVNKMMRYPGFSSFGFPFIHLQLVLPQSDSDVFDWWPILKSLSGQKPGKRERLPLKAQHFYLTL